MKSTSSILLLLLLTFNLVGYRLYYAYLIYDNQQQVTETIEDNGNDLAGLIEIKIPLKLPYPSKWAGTEMVNGEIELNGIQYTLVKRKISGDSITVYCLPNSQKTELHNNLSELAGQSSDNNGPSPMPFAKKILIENDFEQQLIVSYRLPFNISTTEHHYFNECSLIDGHSLLVLQPPEAEFAA